MKICDIRGVLHIPTLRDTDRVTLSINISVLTNTWINSLNIEAVLELLTKPPYSSFCSKNKQDWFAREMQHLAESHLRFVNRLNADIEICWKSMSLVTLSSIYRKEGHLVLAWN